MSDAYYEDRADRAAEEAQGAEREEALEAALAASQARVAELEAALGEAIIEMGSMDVALDQDHGVGPYVEDAAIARARAALKGEE